MVLFSTVNVTPSTVDGVADGCILEVDEAVVEVEFAYADIELVELDADVIFDETVAEELEALDVVFE